MTWYEVETEIDANLRVANFLTGILAFLPDPYAGPVYVAGWEVVPPTGDADTELASLRRRRPEKRSPLFPIGEGHRHQ